ncbi:vesicle transport through interaction with t-SNAREs homolog 1A-like [Centruroides sculpturatus]|uniref:vesicle transport through interaction with t-SNAREs homolog 1A-like n=1 Tax=Centruroides sculpturatus TaxID=218467 RepID=UPI000C6E003F|nr:vesicle transport through interaction with t-SNAREs homolog 1A-like [Centruroides sculpturatus]
MASLMDSFEQQFAGLTADITTKTGRIPNLTKGDKKIMVNQVEKHLEEAQELLEQMDLEVKSMPPNDRPKYQNRMKSYHAEFNRLNKELASSDYFLEQMDLEVKSMPPNDRPKYQNRMKSYHAEFNRLNKELLEQMDLEVKSMPPNDRPKYQNRMKSYHAEFNRLNKELKTQLLDNTERLERSSRKLHTGYKISVETEQIGAEILNDLHSQRETIQKARQKLRETDDDLGKSSRILTGMIRRVIQNRVILFVVGSIILCVIVTAIYFMVKRS